MYRSYKLPVAADPDGQVAGARPPGAAADRGVQHVDALLGVNLVNLANYRGGVGAEVEIDLAGAEALQQAVLAQGHRLDLHRAGQGGEHYLGTLGHFPGAVGPDRPGFQVGRGRFPPDVVDNHFVAALQTVVGHAAAHGAQANKSDFHWFLRIAKNMDIPDLQDRAWLSIYLILFILYIHV